MIGRLLNNNILQEAGELLKSQNTHIAKNEFGISFDELFAVKQGRNAVDIKKTDETQPDNVTEIQLFFAGDVNESGKTAGSFKTAEENRYEKNAATEPATREKDNKLVQSGKKELKESAGAKKKKETSNERKNDMVASMHFSALKFKDLSPDIRQRVDTIISNFRKGRISENVANSMILSILKNSKMENADKIKNIKLAVKEPASAADMAKLKTEGLKTDFSNPVKNTNNDTGNPAMSQDKMKNDKKDSLAGIKKNILKNVDNEKADANVKNIKNDFVLNLGDLRANDGSGRNRQVEPHKVLEQNRDPMFNQIAKNTRIVLTQGQTNFSTMIRPENFGRIDFKFSIKDGKVDGKMIFQNQETADFFRANIQELKAVFQKSNVELGNVDLIMAGTRFADSQAGQNKEHRDNFDTDENRLKIKNTYGMNISNFEENISINNSNYSNLPESKVNLVI